MVGWRCCLEGCGELDGNGSEFNRSSPLDAMSKLLNIADKSGSSRDPVVEDIRDGIDAAFGRRAFR